MALKKEIHPPLKVIYQSDDKQDFSRAEEAEFEIDAGVPDAVTTDVNDFPDMAVKDEIGDPDASVLAQDEDLLDDDVIDLKNPEVAAELSEDPVRLYLREIGQVKLLDSDSEFRLATMIEANRLVISYRRRPPRKNFTAACSVYHSLISDMLTSWERLLEDTERLHHQQPDLGVMLTE